jgi:hypothetical protein
MRELLTLITIIFLLVVGWKQSYRSHWLQLIGKETPTPVAKARPIASRGNASPSGTNLASAPTPTPRDTSWMWEKSKMAAPIKGTHGR